MRRNILRSELSKFFSYHWSLFGILIAILIPFVALFFGLESLKGMGKSENDYIMLCLRASYLGQVGVVVAMAGFMGQEYSHSTLRTTLLSAPSRLNLLLSKELVVIFTAIFAAFLSSMLCFVVLVNNTILSDTTIIAFAIKYATYSSPTFISWTVLGLISGNIVIITKSLYAPIVIIFPMVLGLSQLFFTITKLAKYLPDLAVMNVFQIESQKVFLDCGIGFITQLLWLLGFCFVSFYFFEKRDIH